MATLVNTTINGTLKIRGSQTDNLNGIKFGNEDGKDGNNWCVTPLSKSKIDLGSPTFPFRNIYADSFQLTIPPEPENSETEEEDSNDISNASSSIVSFQDDADNRISSIVIGNNLNSNITNDKGESVPNLNSRKGKVLLFGTNESGTYLSTLQSDSKEGTFNEIKLPAKSGTVSLEGHTHAFTTTHFTFYGIGKNGLPANAVENKGAIYGVYKDKNKNIYLTNANKKYSDENKVVLKHCYGWGSDFLDIFVIRGYISFTPNTTIPANTRIRLGSIRTPKMNYLPGGLVPLSIYRYAKSYTKGMITAYQTVSINSKDYYESYIDIRCENAFAKGTAYGVYFTATYGKIGESIPEDETDDGIADDSELS